MRPRGFSWASYRIEHTLNWCVMRDLFRGASLINRNESFFIPHYIGTPFMHRGVYVTAESRIGRNWNSANIRLSAGPESDRPKVGSAEIGILAITPISANSTFGQFDFFETCKSVFFETRNCVSFFRAKNALFCLGYNIQTLGNLLFVLAGILYQKTDIRFS